MLHPLSLEKSLEAYRYDRVRVVEKCKSRFRVRALMFSFGEKHEFKRD